MESSVRDGRVGPLSPGKTIFIAKQICEGLAEAHKLGVIHRDLKPQNIMVDRAGNIRVMDFGIARSVQTKGITATGMMIGTPEYMAPEQVEGKEIDQRVDIYSLGVILFELLTGTVPFEGDTPITVAIKHIKEEAPEPKTINSNIPDDLNEVVLRCLKKDRGKRYENVEELLSELKKIEKGVPITDRIVPDKKPTPAGETPFFASSGGEKSKVKRFLIPALIIIVVGILGIVLMQIIPQSRSSKASLPPPIPPPQEGKLDIESNPPEATVYVDGVRRGVTPLNESFAPGNYRLRITKSGYKDKEEEINIISNQTMERKYSLSRLPAEPGPAGCPPTRLQS